MTASEESQVRDDEIVKNGRVFRIRHKALLDRMPQDLVQEMARRRLEEIELIKAQGERAAGTKFC